MHNADTAPDVESAIVQQIKRFGERLPDRIKNKPSLAQGLIFFFNAFFELDTERSIADLDPIPWSKIIEYGEYYDLQKEEIEDLLFLIREADNAYLRRCMEKRRHK